MFLLKVIVFLPPIFIAGQDSTNSTITTTTTAKPSKSSGIDELPSSVWPGSYLNNTKRHILGDWLVGGCWPLGTTQCKYQEPPKVEYEGYDGFYNNLARPDSGGINRPLLRRWPAAYADGTYLPSGGDRPNPIEVSDDILAGESGTRSKTGKNALLVFFGQQVVEEILDSQRPACPPEYFNIPIPENHRYRKNPGHTVMPLLRTFYDQRTGFSPNNPRQQINEITPYIDGGLMYGISKQWADQLRRYSNGTIDKDGLLAYSHDGLFPEYNTERLPLANPPPPFHHSDFIQRHELAPVSRFFKLGNPRGNENTFLLTFGVVWFRWHNYIAKTLRRQNPEWPSEKVFNEARKWVIATQQHIIMDEWLPSWTNPKKIPAYSGYDASIDPQIDQFFQSAAFRFGHTLVVSGVYLRDYGRNNCSIIFENWGRASMRTCNVFWRPQDAIKTKDKDGNFIDVDRVLMGMASQLCEREDHRIVEDLRGNVFGPLEFPRRDLMAVNIQRGRDHGLPDFNSARRAFGLTPIENFDYFDQFVHNKTIIESLKKLYKDVNKLDVWVGGILETIEGPGELFETIILDQFRRIRDGDRFWFENRQNGLFTENEIKRIKLLKFYDILMAVTKMDHNDIPTNPFRVPFGDGLNHIHPSCRKNLKNRVCTSYQDGNETNFPCYSLDPLNAKLLNESCVEGESYDYFYNSEGSYIGTFVGLGGFIIATFLFTMVMVRHHSKSNAAEHIKTDTKFQNTISKHISDGAVYTGHEWISKKYGHRPVVIVFKQDTQQIKVLTQKGSLLRVLELSNNNGVQVCLISDSTHLILKTRNEHDLVLKFDSDYLRNIFHNALDSFLKICSISFNLENTNYKNAMKQVVTKESRQEKLEMFFRVVFAQAFKIDHSKEELLKVDSTLAVEISHMELTLTEFADAFNMSPKAEFCERMFTLIDKDRNGSVSFREFVDLLIIFANGTEEEKAKLLFDMYDINATGYLTITEFENMLKSFLETCGGEIEHTNLIKTINNMIKSAGLERKTQLDFEDFKKIIGDDIKKLKQATLGIKGGQDNSFIASARHTIEEIYTSRDEIATRLQGTVAPDSNIAQNMTGMIHETIMSTRNEKPGKLGAVVRYLEKKSLEIFWYTLYTLVLWAIFIERAYYYSVEREHSGLRRIAGYGVTVTRGAASAMMFTYSSLLVIMSKNIITYLRGTMFSNYFPFDSYIEIHKFIAYWALFFTVMHIVGHAFNFYHITTQTADDLTCLFRNYFHATHELPKFVYWCWQTMTGITGIILTLILVVMYTFTIPIVRKKLYNWFWFTHMMYPIFFIFMVLHGSGRLIQEPFFYYFFLFPVIIYTINVLISATRKRVQLPVIKAEILPSNVTMLEFKRPENFEYISGQYVQVACEGLNHHEYHPFTLTSSPNEGNLSVHIRSVGPWTRNIRKLYDDTLLNENPMPKIFLDGPYGEGHQDWFRYEVSILIGGGIGVTPFASILKDIVFRSNIQFKASCKKVYFIWVARSQKQFEWLVDIIRDLEAKDKKKIVTTHIFITQFYAKFDLRTILLYLCERHYQKISQKSLFTNLEAVTHFGRPNFDQFLKSIQQLHDEANVVGVFSCGPPPMTSSIDRACININKSTSNGPTFEHHFKNF